MMLEPSSFDWKSNGAHDIGLIAQDVELVFPELVFTNPTDGYKGVNYSRLPALLISGIQELSHKIANFANYIETKVIKTDKVETKELCIDDLCLTKDQLQQLLDGNTVTPDYNQPTNPEPTPEPVVEPEPLPPNPTDTSGGNNPPAEPSVTPEPEPPVEEPTPDPEPVVEPEPTPVEPVI